MTPVDVMRTVLENGAYDLHLHTSASDGTTEPSELVDEVLSHRLRSFAVTDHDTVAAIPIIQKTLNKRTPASGVRFIPGVELSTDLEMISERTQEIHLLGYFPLGGLDAIAAELRRQRTNRKTRNREMCRRLTAMGMPVSMAELESESTFGPEYSSQLAVVGRVQAANILVRKGFAKNRRDAFERILNPGRPGYAARDRLTLNEAIALIRDNGGVPVVAHPHIYRWTGTKKGLHGRTLTDILRELSEVGLAGVEAFHGEADPNSIKDIVAAGRAAGLLLTGGSDWHGDNRHASIYSDKTDFSEYL